MWKQVATHVIHHQMFSRSSLWRQHVFASYPNPARTIRHRQEKEPSLPLLNYFLFSVACVNDRLWCNLSGHSSPDCTGAASLLVAANILNAQFYPDVINLITTFPLLLAHYISPCFILLSLLSSLSILLLDAILYFPYFSSSLHFLILFSQSRFESFLSSLIFTRLLTVINIPLTKLLPSTCTPF